MLNTNTVDRAAIVTLVLDGVREVLEQSDLPIPGNLDEQTRLIGQSAVLDSLALVTLIVDLEQKLEAEQGVSLALADDRAMSQKNSPFRTVQTFTDYICTLMAEERTNG